MSFAAKCGGKNPYTISLRAKPNGSGVGYWYEAQLKGGQMKPGTLKNICPLMVLFSVRNPGPG